MKFTKIVATISDFRCDKEFIQGLYQAGVNVVRINTAHTTYEGMKRIVDNTRAVSRAIAIMIDTKGPEIRTTRLAEGVDKVEFHVDDRVDIIGDPDVESSHAVICVNYRGIANDVHVGDHILIDDGELDFEVICNHDGVLKAIATNDGKLGSRKTVNVPRVNIDLPAVSERDREFIKYAADLGVDFVAHSFVRTADDVAKVQQVLDAAGSDMRIIAKIENQEGVNNFDDIIDKAYGVMIARGDLGIEVAAERIPAIQRMMISKCIKAHKPVIVATQMLHSMINNPRPTRAEVTDVAEAVYQRADAVMLSGETAAGRYPVEAVKTMARIAKEVERTLADEPNDAPAMADAHVTSFLARQAVMSELRVGTKAIVTDAFHGRTARFIASFRGSQPVFAICNREEVARRLALSYGISPYFYMGYNANRRYPVGALRQILSDGRVGPADRIAYLGSLGGVGATFLEVNTITDILAYADDPSTRLS